MKKIVIAAFLIIPALWAGTTWFTSNQTEQVFEEMLTESNQKLTKEFPFIKVEKQSFEKGFSSSTAKTTVSLNSEIFANEDFQELNLNHVFYHGPVMFTPSGIKIGSSYILTTLDQVSLPPEIQQIVSFIFDKKEPFVSGLQTGVGSNIEVDLYIAPLLYDSKKYAEKTGSRNTDNIFLQMDAISSQFSTNADATRLEGSMRLGAVSIVGKDSNNDFNISMDAAEVEMDIDELYKGAMLEGSVEMKIPEFSFSNNKDDNLTLKGLSIITSADQESAGFSGFGTVDVEKIRVKSADTSYHFPESMLHMRFGIKGLEQESVKKLLDTSDDMRQSQLMLIGSKEPEQAMDEMQNAMTDYFKALGEALKQGVETNNIIELSNEKGKSAIKLDITYTDTKKLFDLKTPREVIAALKGQLKINIDRSMIAGTPAEESIKMPIAMGFAVDKGQAYEALADLGNI